MSVLRITRGDDETLDVVVRDPNGVGAVAGQPSTWPRVDLSEANGVTFVVKDRRRSTTMISKTLADDVAITDAVEGEIAVTVDAADTDGEDEGVYLWEVELLDSADKTRTIAGGWLHLLPDLIEA